MNNYDGYVHTPRDTVLENRIIELEKLLGIYKEPPKYTGRQISWEEAVEEAFLETSLFKAHTAI